jgi:hypothetical protein
VTLEQITEWGTIISLSLTAAIVAWRWATSADATDSKTKPQTDAQ